MHKEEAEPVVKQIDRFREAARELGADESEARFDAALRKVATPKLASSLGVDKEDHPSSKGRLRDGPLKR